MVNQTLAVSLIDQASIKYEQLHTFVWINKLPISLPLNKKFIKQVCNV